jgi:hypothetical protein
MSFYSNQNTSYRSFNTNIKVITTNNRSTKDQRKARRSYTSTSQIVFRNSHLSGVIKYISHYGNGKHLSLPVIAN